MKLSYGLGVILTTLLMVACQSEPVQYTSEVSADPARIKSHLRFLSDDLLEGRDTGSRGHEIASMYIASEFEKYGLIPAGDDGTYMQRMPLVQASIDQSSIKLSLASKQGDLTLDYPKQFFPQPPANQPFHKNLAPNGLTLQDPIESVIGPALLPGLASR